MKQTITNLVDECKQFYNTYYAGPTISATFNKQSDPYTEPVMCIAFADQLKTICSSIFGIPVTRFYNNKSNAWICINKDFHYTEIRPENVITCEEYYYNCSEYKNSSTRYYLSLRDILVYIGTFVLQQDINKEVFINIVQNTIKSNTWKIFYDKDLDKEELTPFDRVMLVRYNLFKYCLFVISTFIT